MRSMIDIQIEEKIFTKSKLSILKGFSMQVGAGEKLAIVGESGVGKSSLLNILGLLDRDYRGEYYLFGRRRMGWMRRYSRNGEIKELDLSCKNQQ